MLKKIATKKLVLETVTLRELSSRTLERVVGGALRNPPRCTYMESTCTNAGELA
jgi:hypothetical protein